MKESDPSDTSNVFGQTHVTRKCVTFLISSILFVISPLILLNTVANFVVRACVRVLAKVLKPQLKRMLNHLGHNYTFENIYKNPRTSVVLQVTFQGNLDEKEFSRILQENILEAKDPNGQLTYPELRQYLVQWCGYYFWKDDENFDFSNHFTVYQRLETDVCKKAVNTDEDISAIWNNLLNKPFKQNKPLWEVVIVQDYHPNPANPVDPHTAFILLFHHEIGDGRSWLHLLRSKLFHTEEQLVVPRIPQQSSGILHSCIKSILFPFKLLYVLADFIYFTYFTNSTVNNDHCVGKMFSNVTGQIPIKALKQIAKSYDVGFTSVLLASFTLALKEFLVDHDRKLKPEAAISAYPTPNHKEDKLRNLLTANMIHLPLPSESPLEILKSCHAQYENNREIFPIATAMVASGTLTGPGILRNVSINRSFPIAFSNFSFGSNALYFDKSKANRCVDILFNVGCSNGISVIGARIGSFEDKVRFSTAVDSSIMTEEEAAIFTKSIEKHISDLSTLTV